MQIKHELESLLQAGVIDINTAERIRTYYSEKSGTKAGRLPMLFAVLGALLIGLGILLILAHNWDEFSRGIKTILAFVPLLIAQGLTFYALYKRNKSTILSEIAGVLLVFAIGAAIALVGQIYHIPGDTPTFMLTWLLLVIPVVYLLHSPSVSLLSWIGACIYATVKGYGFNSEIPWFFWIAALALFPFYVQQLRHNHRANFLVFHHWVVLVVLLIALGTFSQSNSFYLYFAYLEFFVLSYLIGAHRLFAGSSLWMNSYKVIGILGMLVMLYMFSFDFLWKTTHHVSWYSGSTEYIVSLVVWIGALFMAGINYKTDVNLIKNPFVWLVVVFPVFFQMGISNQLWINWIFNLYLLIIGLNYILKGNKANHLGVLNFGLLLVIILIGCRFFDSDLSFIVRGVIFILAGAGFLTLNIQTIRKRTQS